MDRLSFQFHPLQILFLFSSLNLAYVHCHHFETIHKPMILALHDIEKFLINIPINSLIIDRWDQNVEIFFIFISYSIKRNFLNLEKLIDKLNYFFILKCLFHTT